MRGLFVGLGALVAFACGGDFSDVTSGGAGRGGHGVASHAGAGSGGRESAAGGGGMNASAGSSAGTGAAGRVAESAGQGGEPSEAAGAGSGAAGTPDDEAGVGGQLSSSGGKGGSGGHGQSECACNAISDCINGKCVVKPECDCKMMNVECSPLHSALQEAYDCPVEVDCGSCPDGELCAIPYSDSALLDFERTCVKPAAWSDPPQACTAAAIISSVYGDTPTCPQVTGCNVPYAFCDEIQGIVKPANGDACPLPEPNEFAMPNAYCGPAI